MKVTPLKHEQKTPLEGVFSASKYQENVAHPVHTSGLDSFAKLGLSVCIVGSQH